VSKQRKRTAERLAYLDREIAFWRSSLTLDERGVIACRIRLAAIEEEKMRLLAQSSHEPIDNRTTV